MLEAKLSRARPTSRGAKLVAAGAFALIAAACGSDVGVLDSATPTSSPVTGQDVQTDEPSLIPAPSFERGPIPQTPVDFDGIPDRSNAIVGLDEVFFDTFGSGAIALSDATDDDIVGLLDRIPPIDTPEYINPASDPWLQPDDSILGYVDANGQAYAYPHKLLNFHEIVNDNLAGVPVLISYCPLCNSGVVFDRRLDDLRQDGELTFSNTSALFDNDLVMVDRQTTSYWWQVPGRAIVGSLSGAELTVLPSTTTTWAQWQIDQPNTLIITRDLGFQIDYTREVFAGYSERVNQGQTPFPVNPEALADDRLLPATQVIAIEAGGEAAAVPIERLTSDFELEVGGEQFVVVPDGAGGASAFSIGADGSREPAPSRSTFWFAYVASFPEAQVVAP